MNTRLLILFVAVITLSFASCKKGDGDVAPLVPLQAALSVINAGTDTVNIYQNGTRLNITSSYFPGGTLGYFPVNSGPQKYQLKKMGNPNAFVELPLDLIDSTAYTLFIAGQTADKLFVVKDEVPTGADAKQALVKFVNAAPTTNVDVTIGTALNVTNAAFKSSSAFVNVPAGNSTLTVYKTGTTTPLVSRTIKLTAAVTYTLYTKGTPGGTGNNAFAAVLVIDN